MKREAHISVEAWTPGVQARADQHHATALDDLRGSDVFFLVTARIGEDDRVETRVTAGGGAHDLIFRHMLLAASLESIAFWKALDERAGEEDA